MGSEEKCINVIASHEYIEHVHSGEEEEEEERQISEEERMKERPIERRSAGEEEEGGEEGAVGGGDREESEECGIMCYYVMSCNYFLSVTIYVLYNYVQFSWSSVAHRVVSPS